MSNPFELLLGSLSHEVYHDHVMLLNLWCLCIERVKQRMVFRNKKSE